MTIRATCIGNLGSDAVAKALPSGRLVLEFSVAAKNGKDEKPLWVRCSMFGERGAKLAQYLTKGSKVVVFGSFAIREYEKDGASRYSADMVIDDVVFAGSKRAEEDEGTTVTKVASNAPKVATSGYVQSAPVDADIPF